jgi:prepilin-type N-terminal cleavage/methylation domain-containing protein
LLVKQRAFTLIELVMVILIIGILGVASIAVITNAIKGIQLSSAATKLASDLRFAQNMAQATGTWYGVSLEANPGNIYTVYTTTGSVDSVVTNPANKNANFVINLNTDYMVQINSVSIGGGKQVEFSPLGAPWTDKNGVLVAPEAVITLARGSQSKTVRIVPNVGRVYIQ